MIIIDNIQSQHVFLPFKFEFPVACSRDRTFSALLLYFDLHRMTTLCNIDEENLNA